MNWRKIILTSVTALFCVPLLLWGQGTPKTDSLLKALAVAKKDTSKILLLYAIAEQYENSEPDKARKYIKQGGELSREINYQPGIMKSYRMLSYVYSFQSKFDSVIYYNRLVLDIARSRNDSFNIGVSFFNIGIGFRFMSELDSAVVYTLQGAKLLEGKGYSNI